MSNFIFFISKCGFTLSSTSGYIRKYYYKSLLLNNIQYQLQNRLFATGNSNNLSDDNKSRGHKNSVKHVLSLQQNFTDNSEVDTSKYNEGVSYILISLCIAMFGTAFACIPLYEYFCQQSGYLGTVKKVKTYALPSKGPTNRYFEIDFVTHTHLNWEFKPSQKKVVVRPGETTLAFYTAKNLLDVPIIGVAAYHVIPDEAGTYFNKIQCFCFEEQILNPGEEVDLPVLFFLDPDILKDKKLNGVEKITLSYIFFEANSDIPEEYKTLFKSHSIEDDIRSNYL